MYAIFNAATWINLKHLYTVSPDYHSFIISRKTDNESEDTQGEGRVERVAGVQARNLRYQVWRDRDRTPRRTLLNFLKLECKQTHYRKVKGEDRPFI